LCGHASMKTRPAGPLRSDGNSTPARTGLLNRSRHQGLVAANRNFSKWTGNRASDLRFAVSIAVRTAADGRRPGDRRTVRLANAVGLGAALRSSCKCHQKIRGLAYHPGASRSFHIGDHGVCGRPGATSATVECPQLANAPCPIVSVPSKPHPPYMAKLVLRFQQQAHDSSEKFLSQRTVMPYSADTAEARHDASSSPSTRLRQSGSGGNGGRLPGRRWRRAEFGSANGSILDPVDLLRRNGPSVQAR